MKTVEIRNDTSNTNVLLHSEVEKTTPRLYNVKKYAIFAHLKSNSMQQT